MVRFLAVGLPLLALAGCALLAGIEETTTVAEDGDAAGGVDAPHFDAPFPDGDPGELDADIVVPPEPELDATLPAEDGGTPDGGSCTLGTRTAFEPKVSGVATEVCNPGGALTQGGNYAGLDCYGAGTHLIAGKTSTACVGIEYTKANLATFTLRLFSVAKGCDYTCYSDGCGSKMTAHVFAGTSQDINTWKYLGTTETKRTAALFDFSVPAGAFSVIGICRSSYGAENDDVAVDGVSATCR